ncbi:MAG: M15 family metallopeptidase [Eubacteriales bacterium]|nr:M15 family metallopeptidase [Eubacteriales bacterium]MDD4421913.1 M15 family metallopeptidase [Eubacteriales bacterium]HBR30598.1 hypothetical protein [Clostridiales bacterium]
MATKRINKKKKDSSNYLIFMAILTLIALIAAIYLIIKVYKNDEPETSSNEPSDSISEALSGTSHESKEQSEISEVSQISKDPTADYESYIGVDYAIDMTNWEQYVCPADDKEFIVLANKDNPLGRDYVPLNLTDVLATRKDGRATQKMVETAEKALEALMLEAAQNNVTNVSVTSAYRSYEFQESLFNGYCDKYQYKYNTREECEEYVNTFSARPGESEHQTGLVCDMHNLSSAEVTFAQTPEAKWLAENSYRFGFILRYPQDKTEITKYSFEPWHFRFVGRTAATDMFLNDLCLEEYLELQGSN